MEYNVSELAKISGVSPRTIRYYHEIHLLEPCRFNEAGYRIYSSVEVDLLQQILFFRTMEVPLDVIKAIMSDKNYNPLESLQSHKEKLLKRKDQINQLLETIDNSMNELKGGRKMPDEGKFAGFKEEMIRNNEAKYGAEIREKYGDDSIDQSNDTIRNWSKKGHQRAEKLSIIIKEKLKEGFKTKEVKGQLAKEIYELHREWIMCYWPSYSADGHKGLGDMYVADDRFKAYYDDEVSGVAAYLRDVIYENVEE